MHDPRRVLEQAADQRSTCEVQARNGAWQRGQVVRVERGGVVLRLARALTSGTDVRVWLTVEGRSWTFEASVLRAGVPVPDRSQDGVLLGYLDGFREAEATRVDALTLELLPHTGGPVSLEGGGARVVDLSPQEWVVSIAREFPVVLALQADVRLRIGVAGRAPMELIARVHALAQGDTHLLYTLRVASVDDGERYTQIVAEARAALKL